jgi:hypothetical protein
MSAFVKVLCEGSRMPAASGGILSYGDLSCGRTALKLGGGHKTARGERAYPTAPATRIRRPKKLGRSGESPVPQPWSIIAEPVKVGDEWCVPANGALCAQCASNRVTAASVADHVQLQKRIAALKDVPTVVEEGFPNLVVEDWVGLVAKSETPSEVITRLNAAINKALKTPKVRAAFARVGAEPARGSPAEFGNLITSQVAYWGKVVKQSGMKMQQ